MCEKDIVRCQCGCGAFGGRVGDDVATDGGGEYEMVRGREPALKGGHNVWVRRSGRVAFEGGIWT